MNEMKKLKLTRLSKAELDKKDMNKLRGGGCCICGCYGPSGTGDNAGYNNSGSLSSPWGGYGNGSFG
ncbi:MAG: TIGR04149 family rSAM-modified RiPP [Tannerella sp.]|nr:TIGR04149 family rSAM-modified RiPP [Tannerella sp.]